MKHDVFLYLKQRPDRAALERLVGMIVDPVEDLIRKDSRFQTLDLDPADYVGNAEAVIDVLEKHPELLQRPIVVKGNRAIIGRPKDRIAAFLAS